LITALLGIALFTLSVPASVDVPPPIGPISDYGLVLDRHGRARVAALIQEVKTRSGIEVYVLASWENPFPTVRAFAGAILEAWDLERRGPAILGVFLKTEGIWTQAIVGNRSLPDASLPGKLESGTRDLVDHARIEEAMVAMLEALGASAGETSVHVDSSSDTTSSGWAIPLVLIAAGTLIWVIHRRLCPQCGRLLHMTRTQLPSPGDRVYFCRSCGFRRRARRPRQRR